MKRLLLIAFDPGVAHRGNTTPAEVEQMKAAGERVQAIFRQKGLQPTVCAVDLGEKAEGILREAIRQGPFDCVLIGTGIRIMPEHTLLFEMLVNVVHQECPGAKFAFAPTRESSPEAVFRVLGLD